MEASKLVQQINTLKNNKSFYIEEYKAYAVNSNGYKGVAVEVGESVDIDEKFNNVYLKKLFLIINKKEVNVVFLYTTDTFVNDRFGLICMNFLDKKNREIIANTPQKWFEEWAQLVGNTKKKKMIYDVVGEMKILSLLQKNGQKPIWNSTEVGTYDITALDGVYEVKTTKSKTVSTIVVHNQYQLNYQGLDKPLYIAYCKLEANDAGESIDSLYKELINNGFAKDILDSYLSKMNYYEGKSERKVCFMINEIRLYKVDDNFPRINELSFVGGHYPIGIIHLEYTVSLDGIEYIKLL